MMCGDSTECPQRVLEHYLSKDAWEPDFGSKQYCTCPDRAKSITIDKLAIGEKHAIFTPEYYQTTLHMYEREYEGYITDLVDALTGTIDNTHF